jgi:hypothetical protein
VFFILGCQLYGKEYGFIIHTLFDYIPEDEYESDNQPYIPYLTKRYEGDVCHTIIKLSLKRVYIVGDEPSVPNNWSQKLVDAELDIEQEPGTFYFAEKTLDSVLNDIVFQDSLPRIHGCLKNREMTVNSEWNQRLLTDSGNITISTCGVCTKIMKYLFEKKFF